MTRPFVPKIRPHLMNVATLDYVSANSDRQPEVPPKVDCSLGVSPFGCSTHIDLPRLLRREWIENYPPFPYHGLRDAIIDYWSDYGATDLSHEMLTVTAGSMLTLARMCTLFLDQDDLALGYSPQFPEFINTVRVHGGRYYGVPLSPTHNYRFHVDPVLHEVAARKPTLVYVDNPNNPTGQIIALADIEAVVSEAYRHGATVIVDEAYGDFMDQRQSAIHLLNRWPNVVITRSFSKGYALAGLRVGYVATSRELTRAFSIVDDFLVSSPAVAAATVSLKDHHHLPRTRTQTRKVKELVIDSLGSLSLCATDPDVPILAVIHPDRTVDLKDLLYRHGVAATAGFEDLGRNAVRIRIPRDPSALTGILHSICL